MITKNQITTTKTHHKNKKTYIKIKTPNKTHNQPITNYQTKKDNLGPHTINKIQYFKGEILILWINTHQNYWLTNELNLKTGKITEGTPKLIQNPKFNEKNIIWEHKL